MRNGKTIPKRRKNPSKTDRKTTVTAGSGNVFADLRVPQPEIALAKAKLVHRIRELIVSHEFTQREAAARLGLDQPKVSALLRGQVAGVSLERLFRLLGKLGQKVEVRIHATK
jgi:predicted XRE-type DNA-binding protein